MMSYSQILKLLLIFFWLWNLKQSCLAEDLNKTTTKKNSSLRVTIPPVIFMNQSLVIKIVSIPSSKYDIHIDFGDNITERYFSQFVGKSILEIQHTYKKLGNYDVNVSALSEEKFVNEYYKVLVMDWKFKLQLLTPNVLEFNNENAEMLEVKGWIEPTVDDSCFIRWNFHDRNRSFSKTSKDCLSVVKHRFSKPGTYEVSAKVFLDHAEVSIETILSQIIKVVEPITLASIVPMGNDYSTPYHSEIANSTFIVELKRGSHVRFYLLADSATSSFNKSYPLEYASPPNSSDVLSFELQFPSVGVYNISIVAENSLGNSRAFLDKLFFVQIPPQGLKLKDKYLIVPTNNKTNIRLHITKGTNVTYLWRLGNGKALTDHGRSIDVLYKKSGKYLLEVMAYNFVGSQSSSMNIYVQDFLDGVTLSMEQNNLFEVGFPVEFNAIVHPSKMSVLRYIWNITDVISYLSQESSFSYQFSLPKVYELTVIAQNYLSSTKSEPILITIMERISNIQGIIFEGENIIGKRIKMFVSHLFGSDVTYQWNFGNEGLILETKSPNVSHSYSRKGAFNVTVFLKNKLGFGAASKVLYVLDKPCFTPIIQFLHSSRNLKVYKNNDVTLEIKVTINCSVQHLVKYKWKLNDMNQRPIERINPLWLRQKNLNVPAFQLPIGVYHVEIMVFLVDTIIKSSAETNLEIIPEPLNLEFADNSGIVQTISDSEDVVINITITGGDPSLFTRLDWKCSTLNKQPCFSRIFLKAIFDKQTLSFPASYLKKYDPDNYYVFEFISHQPLRKDVLPTSLYRIIHLTQGLDENRFSVSCLTCVNQKLKPRPQTAVKISRYIKSGSWKLFAINERNPLESVSQNCNEKNSKMFFYNISGGPSVGGSNQTAEEFCQAHPLSTKLSCESDFYEISSLPDPLYFYNGYHDLDKTSEGTHMTVNENLFKSLDDSTKSKSFSNGRASNDSTIWELRSNDLLNSKPSFISTKGDDGLKPALTPLSTLHGTIIEGNPGKRLHYNSFLKIWRKFNRTDNHTKDEIRNLYTSEEFDHTIRDIFVFNKANLIRVSSTVFNLQSSHLFIDHNLSHNVDAYLLKVYSGGRKLSEQVFRVFSAPKNGHCQVSPHSGFHMETTFTVHCDMWETVEHLKTLYYFVKYQYEDELSTLLIYFGHENSISFQLPYQTKEGLIQIYVGNHAGILTKACDFKLKVKRRNESTLQIIYKEIFGDGTNFTRFVEQMNHKAILQVALVLIHLRDGIKTFTDSDMILLDELLNKFVKVLNTFQHLNKVSSSQALTSLKIVTQLTNTNKSQFWKSVKNILKKSLKSLEGKCSEFNLDFYLMNVKKALFVYEALIHKFDVSFYETAQIFKSLFKMLLQDHNIGEPYIKVNSSKIITLLTGYQTEPKTPVAHLLLGFMNISISTSRKFDCLLFSAAALNHQEMPSFSLMHTRLTSYLDIYSCNSKRSWLIKKISSNHFRINATFSPAANIKLNQQYFLLHDDEINRHGFEVNESNQNKAAVSINFVYIVDAKFKDFKPRHMPLVVVIRYQNSSQPLKTLNVPNHAKTTDIHLVLSDGNYTVDVYNKFWNYHLSDDPQEKNLKYSLRVMRMYCSSWQKENRQWTESGKIFFPNSKSNSVMCSFKNLGYLSLLFKPLIISFQSIKCDEYFSSSFNQTGLIFICTLVATFLVCSILLHKWKDGNSTQIINMKENLMSSHYFYLVTVTTGTYWDAQTSSKVYIILNGELGISPTYELSGDADKLFLRGSSRTFFIALPSSLGTMQNITIWINNSGNKPSWFISNLIVTDLTNECFYYFNANRWLSVDKNSEILIETELTSSFADKDFTFSSRLLENFDKLLKSRHLLLSFFWHINDGYQAGALYSSLTAITALLFSIVTSISWFQELKLNAPIYSVIHWKVIVVALITFMKFVIVNEFLHLIFSKHQKWCWSRKEIENTLDIDEAESSSISSSDIINYLSDVQAANFDGTHQVNTSIYSLEDHEIEFTSKLDLGCNSELCFDYEDGSKSFDMSTSDYEQDFNFCHNLRKDFIKFSDPLLSQWQKKKNSKASLSKIICGLILVSLLNAFSAYQLIFKINNLSYDENFLWIESCLISMIFTVTFSHPICIFVTSILVTFRSYKTPSAVLQISKMPWIAKDSMLENLKSLRLEDEIKYRKSFPNYGERMLERRTRNRNLKFARPPPEDVCLESRKKQRNFKKFKMFLRSLSIHLIVIILLSLGVYITIFKREEVMIIEVQRDHLNRTISSMNQTDKSSVGTIFKWLKIELPKLFHSIHPRISNQMLEHKNGGFFVGSPILYIDTFDGEFIHLYHERKYLTNQLNELIFKLITQNSSVHSMDIRYLLFHPECNVFSSAKITIPIGIHPMKFDVKTLYFNPIDTFGFSQVIQVLIFIISILSIIHILSLCTSHEFSHSKFSCSLKIIFGVVSIVYNCFLMLYNLEVIDFHFRLLKSHHAEFQDITMAVLYKECCLISIGLLFFIILLHSLTILKFFGSFQNIYKVITDQGYFQTVIFTAIIGTSFGAQFLFSDLSFDTKHQLFNVWKFLSIFFKSLDLHLLCNIDTNFMSPLNQMLKFIIFLASLFFFNTIFFTCLKKMTSDLNNSKNESDSIDWKNLKLLLPKFPAMNNIFKYRREENLSYSWSNLSEILKQEKIPEDDNNDLLTEHCVPTEFLLSELEDLVNQMSSKVNSLTGFVGSECSEETEMDILQEIEEIKQSTKPGLINYVKEYNESNSEAENIISW